MVPMDRVKQSQERLDIPEWYKEKSAREEKLENIQRRPVWRKGSFADIKISSASPPDIVVDSQYVDYRNQLFVPSTNPPSPAPAPASLLAPASPSPVSPASPQAPLQASPASQPPA